MRNHDEAAGLFAVMNRGEVFERRVRAAADVSSLIARLRAVFEASGLTQAELARRLGVRRSQVNRWFREDDAGLNAASAFAIADALGYDAVVELVQHDERTEYHSVVGSGNVVRVDFKQPPKVSEKPNPMNRARRAGVPA